MTSRKTSTPNPETARKDRKIEKLTKELTAAARENSYLRRELEYNGYSKEQVETVARYGCHQFSLMDF